MEYDLLSALASFAFVSSITPGPNNLMLMAAGANHGFRRSIPHMLGIGVGFMIMVMLVGVGLVQVFDMVPYSHLILSVLSVAYLLWLAWKIANAAPPGSQQATGRPFTFVQAALFQWVNPKAWTMAVTAVTLYAPDRSLGAVAFVALVFGVINLPCVSSWTVMGTQMRRFLSSPARLRAFNIFMAILLVASLGMVLYT